MCCLIILKSYLLLNTLPYHKKRRGWSVCPKKRIERKIGCLKSQQSVKEQEEKRESREETGEVDRDTVHLSSPQTSRSFPRQ